jgi:hypothetical protein
MSVFNFSPRFNGGVNLSLSRFILFSKFKSNMVELR